MKNLTVLILLVMLVFVLLLVVHPHLSCNHNKAQEVGVKQPSYEQLWQLTKVQKPPQATPLNVAKTIEFRDASLATGVDAAPKLAHG
ncbi:MAG: hypothetical protein HQL03_16010 [Nitrospirae bacterium]|nr:hypothetical protein [Nitrospirota bacterium]